jgi:hypothetical protein
MFAIRLLPALLLVGCSTFVAPPEAPDGAGARSVDEGTAEAYGVLALLSSPATDEALLDDEVGLDSRAARGLIHHRNGPDGVYGTRDDDLFETIEEVDGVWYVGPSALEDLARYASEHGWVPAGDDWVGAWDGVDFTLDEATAVVELANVATLAELDLAVGLSSLAAQNIVAERPFSTVAELSQVPYVGRAALEDLRATIR